MAYFKINEPNKAVKYIKSIDRANGTLEFSESKNGCFQQDSGFFADSELAYLKFHFTEAYPELEYLTVDTSYNNEHNGWVNVEAPQVPQEEAMEMEEVPQEEEEVMGDGIPQNAQGFF